MARVEPIAIVGIGCRFPGGVTDPASFWELLRLGKDAITDIPTNRMDVAGLYHPRPATPGKITGRWGGYLDHIEEFDPAFFGISPREAERMDPQQRLMLEVAWEAIEDAGVDATTLDGLPVGVYVGQWTSDFENRLFSNPGIDFLSTQGSGRYATSGRISYALGLRGPSLTIDTACSSSLATVHLACQALRQGECQLAFAGGVNVILQPHISIAYSQSRIMASHGRCRFGDAEGDGYVRSEGAALVLLKPMAKAVADGDRIYAVVRGSAINNDGRSSTVMGRPSQVGHEEMLRAAYAQAGVEPGRVGYAEAHGTGTRAGDPIELAALAAVLGQGRAAGDRCWIGSVKTNIGHTESAAGVAGLIKAALALYHRQIPASLHFETPSPSVPWATLPLEVCRSGAAWPSTDTPRLAAVNSFGIAGSNAHAVLEEAPASASAPSEARHGPHLLVLSASSKGALAELASRYAALLAALGPSRLADVCASAARRRTALSERAAFVDDGSDQLVERLRRFAAGDVSSADAVGTAENSKPKVAFVCAGQGSQWLGMTKELSAREPVFRAALRECEMALRQHVSWSLVELLESGDETWLQDIAKVQPALVAVEIALAAQWRSMGVEPAGVVGHSMGEVAAGYLAGAISLADAMAIICHRSELMKRTRGNGGMALVELSPTETQARIAPFGNALVIAGENAPRSTFVSGELGALDQLIATLDQDGVFCRRIKVDVASHSPQMDPVVPALIGSLAGITARPSTLEFYSTVTAARIDGEALDASYWGRNLRDRVRFGPTIATMATDGFVGFLELSPHPILLPAIEETLRESNHPGLALASLRRGEPEVGCLLKVVATLFANGYAVDFRRIQPAVSRWVDLPTYPWQRERYWAEEAELMAGPERAQPVASLDRSARASIYRLDWRPAPLPQEAARSTDVRALIVASDIAIGNELAARLGTEQIPAQSIEPTRLAVELDTIRRSFKGEIRLITLADPSPDAAFLPIRCLQAAQQVSGPIRLFFVTVGAHATDANGRHPVSIDQAALWGAALVVAEEHPEPWGGLVDLDPEQPIDRQTERLARHLALADEEDQVAFRDGKRLGRRIVRAAQERATPARRWQSDGAYLITGGLGDIGLHVARYLARAGVRRLILAGRTPLPVRGDWSRDDHDPRVAHRIASVRELESLGVAVHLERLDVSSESAVHEFVSRYRREAWPPIRGVIHAAGITQPELAATMARQSFDAVVSAKLRSAEILDRAFPDVETFVLFSSIESFLAQSGDANYAAANAGLLALAADRIRRNRPALAIAWGVWDGIGLMQRAGDSTAVAMRRQGLGMMSAEQGIGLFGPLCGRSQGVIVASPMDWVAFRANRRGANRPFYREVVLEAGAEGPAESSASADGADRGPPSRQQAEELIVIAVGAVLKISPDRLDRAKTLGSLGLTSLMAIELRNRLEAAFRRQLSATIAWNYPTIAALAAFLSTDSRPSEPASSEPAPTVPADTTVAATINEVTRLSDEDAILALRAARAKPTR